MAFKANKNTYGYAYSRDAFGVATEPAIRIQVMAGEEFPPGVSPDPGDDAVEEFDPAPYAGPRYSDGYVDLDKRVKERSPEKDAQARERANARKDADAQKLGYGKAAK